MPITITPAPPGGLVGPGILIQLSTSIADPQPRPLLWQVGVYADSDFTQQIWFDSVTNTAPQTQLYLGGTASSTLFGWQYYVETGAQVHVRAQLYADSGALLDQGTLTAPWSTTAGANQLQLLTQGSSTGGLTAEQAAQLQRTDQNTQEMDTNWQTYTSVTLPSLQGVLDGITQGITATLQDGANAVQHTIGDLLSWVDMNVFPEQDLSGGTICTPFRYDASLQNLQSLTVFIDQYPPEFRLVTPDSGWSFHDFAVLTFSRGSALIERHGIHTLSYTVSRLPQSIGPWPLNIRFDVQPTDYHIAVDWAPGVCGHIRASVRP